MTAGDQGLLRYWSILSEIVPMRIIFTRTLAAAALSIAIAGCASAPSGRMTGHPGEMQHPSGMMHGGGMMMSVGPMVGCPGSTDAAEGRVASLHSKLHVSGPQEALWTKYADAYLRSAASIGLGAMGSMESMGAMSLPERMQHHETMMSTHLASFHDLRVALAPLYGSLSVEQRAIADAMACEKDM
jgi:hypothetical protein